MGPVSRASMPVPGGAALRARFQSLKTPPESLPNADAVVGLALINRSPAQSANAHGAHRRYRVIGVFPGPRFFECNNPTGHLIDAYDYRRSQHSET